MSEQQYAPRQSRFQRALLEFIVPCAMALSSMAFAAGLYIQGGFALISSIIAGVTLFLVLICIQTAYVSSQRAASAVERLNELEAAVRAVPQAESPDHSAQLEELEEKVDQFDIMSQRMEQLDVLSGRIDQLQREISRARPERTDVDPARLQRLSAEIDRIDARQDALRSQLQIEAKERHEDVTAELKMLETLVKQVAESVAEARRPMLAQNMVQKLPAPDQDASEADEDDDEPVREARDTSRDADTEAGQESQEQEDSRGEVEPEIEADAEIEADVEAEEETQAEVIAEDREIEEEKAQESTLEPPIDEIPLIDEVRNSIESNRIELYLQPVMTLPQRRVRYYEALTRLRNEAGDIIMPGDYIGAAESSGIMSVIDNVMLYRSVQVLRRLEQRSSARGLFCNISAHSLIDPEFFPEFISFMEQNQTLSENMYFEFSQEMIENSGPVEQESLSALADLGFRFSMDQVTNLDLDFQAMQARGFRFVKVDADILLRGMKEAQAQIHAADMRSYLERFGIQLVISRIETEQDLASVLDYHVKLGQGFVFSEPRPVRPEVFEQSEETAAA